MPEAIQCVGVNFDAIFAADLEPQRFDFQVAGRPAWVALRKMDAQDLGTYQNMAVMLAFDGGVARQVVRPDFDINKQLGFLVSRTLVNWQMWRKGVRDEWEMCVPPETDLQRHAYIETDLRAIVEFWEWLTMRCLEVNGLTDTLEGNSAS